MPLEQWQWKHPHRPGRIWQSASCITIVGVVALGKLWGRLANKVNVCNGERFHAAISDRAEGVPLVTVSNHLSCVDDPVLMGEYYIETLGPSISHLVSGKFIRMPGASDIAFRKLSHTMFFTLGKIVPVVRGDGVYQQGMDFLVGKLNEGNWIHFYPEGKVNMTKHFLRLKWGVGRVIAQSRICPMVVPYWHIGMDEILPNYPPYVPRIGKKVTMLVGEAMDFREMLAQMRHDKWTPEAMRKRITDVIQEEMAHLKEKTEALHYER